VPEFYFTKLIEWTWGKKRILEVYLNTIEMGPGIFGIEAAARKYFKKSAKDLSREEAAMIIACLPNPKKYTVVPVSRWVAWKKNFILRQMYNISDDKKVLALIK
jgi:monofunctional biosynthetic peptidoglycan transglycosylase